MQEEKVLMFLLFLSFNSEHDSVLQFFTLVMLFEEQEDDLLLFQ